jgi:sugar O-acyltransferase (sialic acid O-acetyltransferase NeuD family)
MFSGNHSSAPGDRLMTIIKELVIIGGGGHAVVVADMARACKMPIYGIIDPLEFETKKRLPEERFLSTSDDYVLGLDPKRVCLALGVGAPPKSRVREKIYRRFSEVGFEFPVIVHPMAFIAHRVNIEAAAQVMAGANVQPGTRIGVGGVINTGACVDHECRIERFAHIAPRATLCGCVSVGEHSFVGAGSTILENVTVGYSAVVGAGAVVTRPVEENECVAGVPAVTLRSRRLLEKAV